MGVSRRTEAKPCPLTRGAEQRTEQGRSGPGGKSACSRQSGLGRIWETGWLPGRLKLPALATSLLCSPVPEGSPAPGATLSVGYAPSLAAQASAHPGSGSALCTSRAITSSPAPKPPGGSWHLARVAALLTLDMDFPPCPEVIWGCPKPRTARLILFPSWSFGACGQSAPGGP